MIRYRSIVALALLLGATPDAASADDFYAARREELLRLDPSQGSVGVVGQLGIAPKELAFSSQGELYALDENRRLHRVDPDSLEIELVATLSEALFIEMAVAPEGDVYFVRRQGPQDPGLLTLVDPMVGIEVEVAQLEMPEDPIWSIFFMGGQLFAATDRQLLAIDRSTGMIEVVREDATAFGSSSDVSADSVGRLWALHDPPVTPPNVTLAPVAPDTGGFVAFLADGPSSFAIRRGPASPISIPTLSAISLAALAGVLGLLGFAVLRSRREGASIRSMHDG